MPGFNVIPGDDIRTALVEKKRLPFGIKHLAMPVKTAENCGFTLGSSG